MSSMIGRHRTSTGSEDSFSCLPLLLSRSSFLLPVHRFRVFLFDLLLFAPGAVFRSHES